MTIHFDIDIAKIMLSSVSIFFAIQCGVYVEQIINEDGYIPHWFDMPSDNSHKA